MTTHQQFAPGLRIEARDTEWRIKRVDYSSDGGYLLTCEGLSEIVRGKESLFLTEQESQGARIRILNPECVFQTKAATISRRKLPLVPFQSCHRFR